MQQIQITRIRPVPHSFPQSNQDAWFRATSPLTAQRLQKLFKKRNVGIALLRRVKSIVQGPKKNVLFLNIKLITDAIVRVDQLSKEPVWATVRSYEYDASPWPEWAVEVCLRELGITLEEEIPAAVAMAAQHGSH